MFGELALIVNEPRVATAIATDTTRCLAFNKEEFMELLRRSGRQDDLKKITLERIRANFREDFKKLK
jgi:CRP-like cAMP-binding protein